MRNVYYSGKKIATCKSLARVAWSIINHYAKLHPGITLEELRVVFATVPSYPKPLICEWNEAVNHRNSAGKLDKRYCIDAAFDKIVLSPDLIVTISCDWQDSTHGNYPIMCDVAQALGYEITD